MNSRIVIVKISFNVFNFSEESYTQEWIDKRIDIFMKYTLKSLKNQSNQNFHALIEYEWKTRILIRNALEKYDKLPDNVHFVTNAEAYIKKTIKGYKNLYLTRVDSDDMYHRSFIQQLYSFKPKKATRVLINQRGYIYDSLDHRLGEYFDNSPPFYTFIYKVGEYLRGVRYILPNGHPDAIYLPHELLPDFNYMVTVHSKNTETIFDSPHRGIEIRDALRIGSLLDEFMGKSEEE